MNRFKILNLFPFLGLLAFLSACSVGPDYVKPTPLQETAPPIFKEMSGWKQAQPKDDLLRGNWWEMYGDSQLNALEEKVDISNQNLAAAEAQFRQARAGIMGAKSAYYPTLSVGLSASRSRVSTNSGGHGEVSSFSFPFEVSWEPDLWGRVRRTVEASKAVAQASAADLEGVRLSAHALLAEDYFQLRSLDAQKKLLETTVAEYRKSLELTKFRYDAGVASSSDVLQAETQLKTAQAQLTDLGVARAQLEHAIASLIGKPSSAFSIPESPLAAVPPAVPVAVPSTVLERRPDVAAAERTVAAANARIGVAKAAYYPNLTIGASAGFQSTILGNLLSLPSRFWSVGPSLSETLFDGGARRAQTEEAQAAYDATVAQYRQTVLTVFQEVEDALAALRILENEARTQDEAVAAAKRSLEVTMNRYQAGIVSYLDVVVAQTTALAAERTAADIAGRRMNASVLLIKALGGGWESGKIPADADMERQEGNNGKNVEKETSK